MKSKYLNPMLINLQLLAEGGAAAGTGAGDGGTGAAGTQGVTAAAAMSQKGVSSAEGTVPAAEGQVETVAQQDLDAEFESLIKGKFKGQYGARVQDTVQKRLKGTMETVEKFNALTPTLEMLAQKYGVDAGDIEALNAAIQDDDSYYEQEALERGITVSELKQFRKMERENAELRRQMREQETRENANRLYSQWMKQEQDTKAIYPSFSLEAEMQNPKFVDLLRSNIDVRTAYEVLHKDEIIPAAMQFTAKAVEQKITNKIMANGARPAENGMASQGATVVKTDVSQYTKADRAALNRRVARGEKITLG